MNEQTAEIIKALAIKFGTTSEYLWSVMVKQAPITAVTMALIDVTLIVGIYIGFKFIYKIIVLAEDKFKAEWEDESAILAWFILCAYTIFAVIVIGCSFIGIITGLFNPEYWALMQILGNSP